jgi:cytochrome c oxidase subunit II
MNQDAVWAITMLLMAAAAGVFAWVATSSESVVADYRPVVAAAYRLRPWLFGFAALVLVAANWKAIEALPYVSHPGLGAPQRVDVVGEQWSWSINPRQVTVGRPVEFHVTSKDVNHGFALYDQGLRIVAQTQAMPHYVNILRYTFTAPGTYRVLCLEFCGVSHHQMMAEITAVAR